MDGERIARSGIVSLAGSGFAAVAALVLTSIVSNALGASGTGLFFQAMGIFTILTQVLRLGTNSGIVRFIAEQRAFERRGSEWRIVLFAVVPVMIIAALAGIGVWLAAQPLAVWLAAAPAEAVGLADLLRAMAPYVAAGAVLGVLQIASRMLRGVTTFTLLQSVLLPASRLVSVLIVSLGGVTAWAAFEAWLMPIPLWFVATVLVLAAPIVRDFRSRRTAPAAERPHALTFWRFNAPRAVSAGLETALEWADVLIIAALASPAAAGIYAVITRSARAGGVVDKAMRVAVSPTISGMLARRDVVTATALHTKVVRAMILTNWPFYLLLISMGPAVLMIFGQEFVAGWGPMILLAVAMMFQSAAGMLQSILLQGGRSTWQLYDKTIALVLSIVGNLVLVPRLGLWGAAITYLTVVVADNLIAAVQVHRGMGVRLHPGRLIPAALVPLIIFGGGGALFSLGGQDLASLIIAVAVLSLVYAVALWLLRHRFDIVTLWRRVPVIRRWA